MVGVVRLGDSASLKTPAVDRVQKTGKRKYLYVCAVVTVLNPFAATFADYNGPGFVCPPNPGVASDQNNTITSRLTVNAGVLTMSANVIPVMTTTIAAGGVLVQGAGSLILSDNGVGVYAVIVNGGVVLNGGTIALLNASSGSHTISISGGIVQTGGSFSLSNMGLGTQAATLSGGIAINGGVMSLLNTGGGAYSTVIEGGVIQNGGSTLVVSGATTMDTLTINNGSTSTSGGGALNCTTVSLGASGALTIGSDATLGTLKNSGTVQINAATSIGSISGSGTLAGTGPITKTGPGVWNMGADYSGSGVITLSGGALYAGGHTLGGAASAHLINNATFCPGTGTEVGRATVAGDFSGNGTLLVRINGPGAGGIDYDQVKVNGTATLSEMTLSPTWGSNPSVDSSFVIVDASGGGACTTTFASVEDTESLTTKVTQNVVNNQLILTVTPDLANPALGLNRTQRGVADSLSTASRSSDLTDVINAISRLETADEIKTAYDQMTPRGSQALSRMAFSSASVQCGNLSTRMDNLRLGQSGFSGAMADGSCSWSYDGALLAGGGDDRTGRASMAPPQGGAADRESPWGFFAFGETMFGDQDTLAYAAGYDFTQAGATIGIDYRFCDELALGWGGGYAHIWSDMNEGLGRIAMDSICTGPYALVRAGDFYSNLGVSYARNSYDVERNIGFPGIDDTACSNPDADQLIAFVGAGYDFRPGSFIMGPTASFQFSRIWIDRYAEDGAGALNLNVGSQEVSSVQSGLGWRMMYSWKIKDITLSPKAWAFWLHEFDQDSGDIIARIGDGDGFATPAAAPERDFANVGAGLVMDLDRTVSANLSWSARVGAGHYTENTVSGGIRILF